ncbi:hypothetical protein EG832_05375 [bacterium]|nr:hypothetical protein [bacterium]
MQKEDIRNFFKGNYKAFYSKYLTQIKNGRGNEYSALCPFHDDKQPSLNFNSETGEYYCHGCGKNGHVVNFYAQLNNLDKQRDYPRILSGIAKDFNIPVEETKRQPVKTYDYVTQEGKLIFQVCRYEPKSFSQRRMNGNGKWVYNLEGVQRVLYRLPEVMKNDEVIIVEGEKDADNVAAMGFCGTTCPQGAGKWYPEYTDSLKGKNIVLCPDNDTVGREHMTKVGASLKGIAKSLKWLELPDLPDKGDISDWLTNFKSKEEAAEKLSMLIESAPGYEAPANHTHTLEDAVVESGDYLRLTLPPKRKILDIISEQEIILASGWRGVGKSWFGLSLVDAVTRNQSFGMWKTINCVPCLYMDGEMSAQDVQTRLNALNPDPNRKEPLHIYSDAYASTLGIPKASLMNEEWRSAMKELLTKKCVRFWVLDNLASLAGGIDENSKRDFDPINAWLLDLRYAGITTMMLHHVGKEGHQRGTSAKEDHLDLSLILKQPPDYVPENGAAFIVTFTKSRLSFHELPLLQDIKFQLIPDPSGRLSWVWGSVKQETRREVLGMIGQGATYDEIACALQISKGRISQIKKEAVEKGILDSKGKLLKEDF